MNVRCPHCQIMVQVADDQEGVVVRCAECTGMMRVPLLEKEAPYEVIAAAQVEQTPERPEFVKEYLKKLHEEVARKALEVPYQSPARPIGKIAGWTFIGIGVLAILCAGLGGGMGGLVFGVLLPMMFFLAGAICLIVDH